MIKIEPLRRATLLGNHGVSHLNRTWYSTYHLVLSEA